MADQRFTLSLFDKLTGGSAPGRAARPDDEPARTDGSAGPYRFYTVPQLDRFGTSAVKNVVRRDLSWLFNTINLGSTVDLADVPEVQRSVLNFGVSDLSGKIQSRRLLEQRARDMRNAIRTFEPRLARDRLDVVVASEGEHANTVTFVIRSDVLSPVQPLPVAYKTEVEVETGATDVRE